MGSSVKQHRGKTSLRKRAHPVDEGVKKVREFVRSGGSKKLTREAPQYGVQGGYGGKDGCLPSRALTIRRRGGEWPKSLSTSDAGAGKKRKKGTRNGDTLKEMD